jgi:hypothetical protein
MDSSIDLSILLGAAREHWSTTVILAALTIIAIGIFFGDGTPLYNYPFVGQGLLKPWLNWTTADRWRLHELESIAFEKV